MIDENFSIKKELFTEKEVYECFKQVTQEPRFSQKAKDMRLRCLASGGRALAADTVERVFLTGLDHLVDDELISKSNNRSFVASSMVTPILLSMTAALGYLVYEKY
mmetsp:Transcript_13814/g.23562  ORF Transcript_13814/g.23562 Transcript_13814/m.23562 type:complete len:106 (+) Transcript_13814:894-1211(+)